MTTSETPTWTNATLRKELGEHGFLEIPNSLIQVVPDSESDGETFRSAWVRHDKLLYMITRERGAPSLEDSSGNIVDIQSVGYRNVNVQRPQPDQDASLRREG